MFTSLRQRFHSALRYKLLVLVLLPLASAMAVTLGYTLYWLHSHTQETLSFSVRENLGATRRALRQSQDEYQLELQQLAESPQFRALIKNENGAAIRRSLRRVRDTKDFAFLHVTGIAGDWRYEGGGSGRTSKPSPLADRAERGVAGSALEVFSAPDLQRESAALADSARIALRDGAGVEARALVLRLVQPITDDDGRVVRILDAGVLLNRNSAVIDTIERRVFRSDTLPAGAQPIVALLLNDIRIAAASRTAAELEGERVLPAVRSSGAAITDVWSGPDTLLGETYVSAYGLLFDVNGQRVGQLQVGVRQAAFRAAFYRAAALLLLLFVGATGLAAWLAVRGVRTVFGPVETMAAVVRATQAGEDKRIGPIGARDEIGELARQFDAMLDQLAARKHEMQRDAVALEDKVAARTQELADRNAELQQTITLLEKTREQLVLAEKLSALGQMAAGIAHEINNPAAVILGNLDVIVRVLGERGKPVAHEIDLIGQQVERIRHIVTSLLQFARARPGAGPIRDVSVNQAVDDVLPLVTHVLKEKSIVLHRRRKAKGEIAIDLFDLEQVLINLIVNAANACEAGGVIEITTADWKDGGAVISVRDNGRGIAPDQLNRIFDPFFTTDPKDGSGLGLSVSYGLVRRYGGNISVESTLGRGSVFRVWLMRRPPLATEASTVDGSATPTPHGGDLWLKHGSTKKSSTSKYANS